MQQLALTDASFKLVLVTDQRTDASFKLVSVTDTSKNHLLLPMIMAYSQGDRKFPWLDRIFPEEKIQVN